MAKEATKQVAFRLPESLLHRLDRHAKRLEQDHPGLEFTRVDALRTLLTLALDQVEVGEKRRPKKS